MIESIKSQQFRKSISTAFGAVLVFLFSANFALPFVHDQLEIQVWLLKFIKVGVVVLVFFGLLHVFPLLQHLKNVKNGASLFPSSAKNYRYQPWPAHSHPVARNAGWGPVAQDYEVYSKKTRIVLATEIKAIQKTTRLRIGFTMFGALLVAALALFPIVMNSIVYEITPPQVEALQKFAYMTWPLFAFWFLVALTTWLVSLMSRIPLAELDKKNNIGYLKFSRCFGLLDKFLEPDTTYFRVSDVAGLQLAHHRAKSLKRSKRRIDQYELILVLSDGKRHLLTKGSRHNSVLKDAIKIAKFIGVDVWDRSSYYRPDNPTIVSPIDPVIKSL